MTALEFLFVALSIVPGLAVTLLNIVSYVPRPY